MSYIIEKHSKKSHYSSEKQLRIADKQLQQALWGFALLLTCNTRRTKDRGEKININWTKSSETIKQKKQAKSCLSLITSCTNLAFSIVYTVVSKSQVVIPLLDTPQKLRLRQTQSVSNGWSSGWCVRAFKFTYTPQRQWYKKHILSAALMSNLTSVTSLLSVQQHQRLTYLCRAQTDIGRVRDHLCEWACCEILVALKADGRDVFIPIFPRTQFQLSPCSSTYAHFVVTF